MPPRIFAHATVVDDVGAIVNPFAVMAVIRHRTNTSKPKKHCAGGRCLLTVPDPLVGSVNPADLRKIGAETHTAYSCDRMVDVETGLSGRRAKKLTAARECNCSAKAV